MVRRSRPLALDADSRLSRRRAMQLGLGAAAAYGLTTMPMAPARVGAQDTGAADVTGPFDWKRHDGTTIRALVNTHPYTDALKGELEKFTELTGITVQYDEFPESNYFEKLTVDLQSGQPSYDVFMLGAYFVWQYGPPGYLEDFLPWIENESATNPDYDWEDIYPNLRSSDQWSLQVGDPLGTGGQYALPWGFETNTVMYNTEIFDALGVKPAETFDELVELARTINEEAPGAGFPDTYGIGARGARQWATIHPGFMTQYSREGGKDFELQGDVLVPVMNSDVAVAFTDKWAAMLRDAGPPNWTNYYWYEVGTDLGAGKAAMIYDADILGYFNNIGDRRRRQDRLASGTDRSRWLTADQPVDLVTRDERHVDRTRALPGTSCSGRPARITCERRRSIRTSRSTRFALRSSRIRSSSTRCRRRRISSRRSTR